MNPQHNYHLVDPSPWPLLSSFSLFYLTLSAGALLHFFINGLNLFQIAILLVIILLTCWWRDIIREGTFTFHHTNEVQKSLRFGMLLFIVSKYYFFLHFFGHFFIQV